MRGLLRRPDRHRIASVSVRDRIAGILDRLDVAIEARLQVQRTRRGDGQHHLAARLHHRQPLLGDVVAGLVEALADVGEPGIGGIGVVRRSPGCRC